MLMFSVMQVRTGSCLEKTTSEFLFSGSRLHIWYKYFCMHQTDTWPFLLCVLRACSGLTLLLLTSAAVQECIYFDIQPHFNHSQQRPVVELLPIINQVIILMALCQCHSGGGAIVLHINLTVDTCDSSAYQPYCVFPLRFGIILFCVFSSWF